MLKDSSNIITLLHDLKSSIFEHEKWVSENKQRVNKNILISEQYCISHRMNIEAIKNKVKASFEKKKKEAAAQALRNAESKRQKMNGSSGGPKKDDDKKDKLRISDKDKGHIFRDAEGHFPKDTPEARTIIEDMVNNKENFQGLDKYGNEVYLQNLPDGSQLWAKARNGFIRWAGKNAKSWGYKPGIDLIRPFTENIY